MTIPTWKEMAQEALNVSRSNTSDLLAVMNSFSNICKHVHLRLELEGNVSNLNSHPKTVD